MTITNTGVLTGFIAMYMTIKLMFLKYDAKYCVNSEKEDLLRILQKVLQKDLQSLLQKAM